MPRGIIVKYTGIKALFSKIKMFCLGKRNLEQQEMYYIIFLPFSAKNISDIFDSGIKAGKLCCQQQVSSAPSGLCWSLEVMVSFHLTNENPLFNHTFRINKNQLENRGNLAWQIQKSFFE